MSAQDAADLTQQVHAWIVDDPDPRDAEELRALADQMSGDYGPDAAGTARAELQDRFRGMLQFGTAGLRGRIGAGPNRMNRAVVIRAAAGLMGYLNEQIEAPATVVIGYDARYRSQEFATDTAQVVAGAGGQALVLPGPAPTPLLAFAVRYLGADAGVMVTASHNPPEDNGYKVYLGGRATAPEGAGVQIVPPADTAIAAHIATVSQVAQVARSDADIAAASGLITQLNHEVQDAYIERALSSVPPGPRALSSVPPGLRDLRIVLTPMHGVGGRLAQQVLARAGFTDVTVVPEQAEPDPDFPTVAFPNPEEPGALDLAIATARRVGADLIIANDPDADRCSIAVPQAGGPERSGPAPSSAATFNAGGRKPTNGDASDGSATSWRQLTGDEVGALLGEQAARAAAGQADAVLASSIVSSRLLGEIAAAHGIAHQVTLTGFKWIARTPGLVFGYEEAIGYCIDPEGVRDKDGITAALGVAVLAAQLKAAGRTLVADLDDLARRDGLHATAPLSVRVDDLAQIPAAMARLRATPPTSLAGSAVVTVRDLADGGDGLPPTDGLLYLTADNDRVIVRPSGTEPKVKCYLEAVLEVGAGDEVAAFRQQAAARLVRLSQDIGAAAGLN